MFISGKTQQFERGVLIPIVEAMCIEVEQDDCISRLPVELQEEVARYLNSYDILSCSRVCQHWKNLLNNETIWRRLCIIRGWYLNKVSDINCWQNLYWLNHNWQKGLFASYTFSDDGISISPKTVPSNLTSAFTDSTLLESDGEFLILPRRDVINIWEVDSNDVKIHQKILNDVTKCCSTFDLKVNNKYIIYLTGNYIQIYKKQVDSKMFLKIKMLHLQPGTVEEICCSEQVNEMFEHELDHKIDINENHLCVLQDDRKAFMWTLKPWEYRAPITFSDYSIKILEIKIVSSHLFILQKQKMCTEIRIRVFDLIKNAWILNLQMDSESDEIHPRLIISKCLIVLICPVNIFGTVLKVWDYSGNILRTTPLPIQTYRQCAVTNDIVIYRSSSNTITLWSSRTNKIIKELDISSPFSFIEVCPGDLLLIACRTTFEIWNWKSGTKLYTIDEKIHLCYNRLLNSSLYATLVMNTSTDASHIIPQIKVFYFGENILK